MSDTFIANFGPRKYVSGLKLGNISTCKFKTLLGTKTLVQILEYIL